MDKGKLQIPAPLSIVNLKEPSLKHTGVEKGREMIMLKTLA